MKKKLLFEKLGFKKRMYLFLFVFLFILAVLIFVFQYSKEKNDKISNLKYRLSYVAGLTRQFIETHNLEKGGDNFELLDSLKKHIPLEQHIRIAVIDLIGNVLYDSDFHLADDKRDQLHHLEIQQSKKENLGIVIEKSVIDGKSYYYYTDFHKNLYIKTTTLFDFRILDFLQKNLVLIIYIIFLFLIIWFIIWNITKEIGKTITKLKEFTIRLRKGEQLEKNTKFSNKNLSVINDELRTIGNEFIIINEQLNNAKDIISIQKNKLFNHLHALNEGVAFFLPEEKKVLTNHQFIQFLNLISEQSSTSAENIFRIKEFKPIIKFINNHLKNNVNINPDSLPQIVKKVYKNNKYFHIRCIFFLDKSFEIIIKDTTKYRKRKLIKEQLTANIAHELKTPVAAVMGYLETLKTVEVDQKKQKDFIDKAFHQITQLSKLIENLLLLNKVEGSKKDFYFNDVNINEIVDEVNENLNVKLKSNNIKININFKNPIIINGNKSLLISVFYNLFVNAIKYGGNNIEIDISNYFEDIKYHYFSFSNTGNSIEERHLSRIFDRFYRIDIGRSRKKGGTGLGLAIVKTAIKIHGGSISARKYEKGGIKFLFTLEK